MADEPEDDVLDLTDDMREDAQPEPEAFHIEIEGEEPEAEVTPLVKQLREQIRERDRKLAARQADPDEAPDPGPRPKLADFDYDEDKHDAALESWVEARDKARAFAGRKQRAADAEAQTTQKYVQAYANNRAKLPVSDFDAAEATVREALTDQQKAWLLRYADDSAKAVYALAKYPAKLDALAAIEDGGDFIKAVNRMEASITVGTHKPKPPKPEMETVQSGSAPLSGGGDYDKQLAKLEKEWEASGGGSRAKISAFKRTYKERSK